MVQGPAQGFFGALGRLPAGRWGPPRQGVRYLGPSGVWDPFSWAEIGPLGTNDYAITRQASGLQQPIRLMEEKTGDRKGPATTQGQWGGSEGQIPLELPDSAGNARFNRLFSVPDRGEWRPIPSTPGEQRNALADLLAGARNQATVTDPAMLSGSFRTGILGKRPVRRVLTGNDVATAMRDGGSEAAEAYAALGGPAPGARWSDETGRWEYADGTPAETFDIDWATGLPSDTPIAMRGRSGALRMEDQLRGADSSGFGGIDPGEVQIAPRRSGAAPASYELQPVVFANADGTFTVRNMDPLAAVAQESPNPDSTAAFERTQDVTLGQAVQRAMQETKTPVLTRPALIQAYKEGRFRPLPSSEIEAEQSRGGTLLGYLDASDGGRPLPVYAPRNRGEVLTTVVDVPAKDRFGRNYVAQEEQQIYRVGGPLNRDEDRLREELREGSTLPIQRRKVPQTQRAVGVGKLSEALDRYRILPREWQAEGGAGEPSLFDALSLSAGGLQERALALRGQPAASLPAAGRLDVYRQDGPQVVQSLAPEVGPGGRYTGRFLPIDWGEDAPAVLLGDTLQRIKAEEFGRRQGLSRGDAGLEGTVARLGKGAYMSSPSAADGTRLVARLVVEGKITPEQLASDSRIAPLFRPGSNARKILKQEVISESNGAMRLEFPDDAPTAVAAPPLPARREARPGEVAQQLPLFGSDLGIRRAPEPVAAVVTPQERLAAWLASRAGSPLPRPVAGRLTPEAVARIEARLAEQGSSLGSLTALSQPLAENAGPVQLALQMADGRPVASLLPDRMAPQRRYLQRWENEMAAEDPWIQSVQPSRDYQPYLRGFGPEAVRRIPPAASGTRVRPAGPYADAPYYTARRPAVFGGAIPEGQLPLPW